MTEYEVIQAERTKALEVKVQSLESTLSSVEGKLDELLELKSKGMGAFWLASLVVGTIISLAGSSIIEWFRGY